MTMRRFQTLKIVRAHRILIALAASQAALAGDANAGWRLVEISTHHTHVAKSDGSILPPGGSTGSAKLDTSGTVTLGEGHAYDYALFNSVNLNVSGFGLYMEIWKWKQPEDLSLDPYAEFRIKATAKGEAVVIAAAGGAATSGYSEIKVRCGGSYEARVDWGIAQSTTGGVSVGGGASSAGLGASVSSLAGGTGTITGGDPSQPEAYDFDEGDVCGEPKYIQTSRAQCTLTVDADGGLGGAGESKAKLTATAQAEFRWLGDIDCQ